ncbi:hypothetical protein OROMI_009730 [Orobanche minor]
MLWLLGVRILSISGEEMEGPVRSGPSNTPTHVLVCACVFLLEGCDALQSSPEMERILSRLLVPKWKTIWRDSFITHRAFCDALAQESARNLIPPSMGSIGSHLLGLSQISALQSDQHHQTLSNQDMLRLGGSGGTRPGTLTQFESLFGPGFVPRSPSSRSPPTSSPAAGLFLHHQQLPNTHEDRNQSSHGMLAPNMSSSSLHPGLMQFPQINNSSSPSSSTGFFNLSFFPCSSNAASSMDGGHHSGRGDDSTHLFSTGGLMSIPIPSMYSTSSNPIQTPLPHMSATALLQKAAQLGSTATTTSNNPTSSLLKSLGKSGPNRHHSFGYFGENNNHMHDLVNAVAGGGGVSSSSSASIFGGLYGADQNHDDHDQHDQINDGEYKEMFHANNINDHIDSKLVFDYDHDHDHGHHHRCDHPSGFTINGMEEAGRLTRDFLGVGEIVRNVREFHNGVEMSAVDRSQGKITPSQSKSFGGGSF